MSSHHFVKEGQEPALLILEGKLTEATSSLLEWAPLLMVSAAAAQDVLLRGIKIDIIICRERDSSTEMESLIKGHGPVRVLKYDEDSSAFLAALLHLKNSGATAINVVASDVTPLFEQSKAFSNVLLITIFDGYWRSSVIRGGHYEKWLPEKTAIKMHAEDAMQTIETEGLAPAGVTFQAISAGIVKITSDGTFWVSEQYS